LPQKTKKSGGKKIQFLIKFKHENSHFLLANLLQIINIIMQIVKRKETLFAGEQQHRQRSSLPHHFLKAFPRG
jgi:hypothetical protein